MTVRVHGDSASGNCLKVKWILDHLGVPYEWLEYDVRDGRTRSEDFLRLNPAGQVPVVELADGRPLAQSGAVLTYFGDGTHLTPKGSYDRAKMFEWMFWEQYSHEPYIAVRRYHMFYLGKPPEELDPKLFERGSAALARMEAGLEGRAWLAGDSLSLADIALVAYTRMAGQGGFDLGGYPNVRAWIARVEDGLGIGRFEG